MVYPPLVVYLWFTCGLLVVFLWFTCGFTLPPLVYLWFTCGLLVVYLWFTWRPPVAYPPPVGRAWLTTALPREMLRPYREMLRPYREMLRPYREMLRPYRALTAALPRTLWGRCGVIGSSPSRPRPLARTGSLPAPPCGAPVVVQPCSDLEVSEKNGYFNAALPWFSQAPVVYQPTVELLLGCTALPPSPPRALDRPRGAERS